MHLVYEKAFDLSLLFLFALTLQTFLRTQQYNMDDQCHI